MPRGVYPRKRHKISADNPPTSISEAQQAIKQLNLKLLDAQTEITRLHYLMLQYRRALAKYGDFSEFT